MRVTWTKDVAEWLPMAGVRLEPGEQDVTDEQYAAITGSAWVEDVPARGRKRSEPEPADDAPADTPPDETPADEAPAEEEQ